MRAHAFISATMYLTASLAFAAAPAQKERPGIVEKMALSEPSITCGELNEDPTAYWWNESDRAPRTCPVKSPRKYSAKHKGIGYQILDFESEACFVPDESYKVLDEIVDKVLHRVSAAGTADAEQRALLVSQATSAVLTEMGFALWVPTETLSDSLVSRRKEADQFRRIFDCDTGSFVLLTIAELLNIPAYLVESTIPSSQDPKRIVQHNFVRWPVSTQRSINWDMNAKQVCKSPSEKQLPYQGQILTTKQLWGYEKSLRADLWERQSNYEKALEDYRQAMTDFPERPGGHNGFAWIVATKEIPNRRSLLPEALAAALRASGAREDANMLDTLACVYALRGDFNKALETQNRALAIAPKKSVLEFERRRNKFLPNVQQDCTGEP